MGYAPLTPEASVWVESHCAVDNYPKLKFCELIVILRQNTLQVCEFLTNRLHVAQSVISRFESEKVNAIFFKVIFFFFTTFQSFLKNT